MPRESAAGKARRLLALLGTLERDAEFDLAELAGSLGVHPSTLADDLSLLSMCGVAPYAPGDLVPVYTEDGAVHVFGSIPALDRTVRLTAEESRALATALQLAGRTATDPLVVRLLEATSETDAAEVERVIRAASATDPGISATLARGAASGACVRIAYRTAGSEEETERVIEPYSLFNERGAWYAESYCRLADGPRTFRLDRVREAELLEERSVGRGLAPAGTAVPSGALPVARIRLAPGTAVPERDWPGVRVVAGGGEGEATEVEVAFAGTAWLARQVLSYLGDAEVLAPEELRDAVRGLAVRERERPDTTTT